MSKIKRMMVKSKADKRTDEIYPQDGNPADKLGNWIGKGINYGMDKMRELKDGINREVHSQDETIDKLYPPDGNPAARAGNYMAKKIKGMSGRDSKQNRGR